MRDAEDVFSFGHLRRGIATDVSRDGANVYLRAKLNDFWLLFLSLSRSHDSSKTDDRFANRASKGLTRNRRIRENEAPDGR